MIKILIVKTSALGDIIHTFPALSHLRACYPNAQIDWVVERPFAELVASHPQVDNVFIIESRTWRSSWWKKETRNALSAFRRRLKKELYDIVIDFQGNIKSGLVTWCAQGKRKIGFGRRHAAEIPNILFTTEKVDIPAGKNIREDYLALASYATGIPPSAPLPISLQTEKELPLDGYGWVLVCPGARWINKQLTLQTMDEFLDQLHSLYKMRFLLAWGNEEEHEVAINLHKTLPAASKVLPRLSLPSLQKLMGQVDLVIAMDSLPLHLAATTKTPTFSFFGPSSAQKYAPVGGKHGYFQGLCPYGKSFEKRCPILRSCKTGACLREVGVEKIVQSFQSFWN